MSSKVLCFCTDNIIYQTVGGVERITDALSKGFTAREIKVVIISFNSQDDNLISFYKNGIKYYTISKLLLRSKSLLESYLSEIISNNQIDIMINQSTFQITFDLLILLKKSLGYKLISTIHTDPKAALKSIKDECYKSSFYLNPLLKMFRYLKFYLIYPLSYILRKKSLADKYTMMYNESDFVVLLSKNFIQPFINISKIKNTSKLKAIPNPNSYYPNPKNKLRKKKQILFVSRMIFEAKRPDRMLKIWKEVFDKFSDWKLIFIGDGPDLNNLKGMSRKLKLKNIDFIGRHDPTKYYAESKIICLTSSYEGFGMVLTEAMQYSCVPIAYNSYESLDDIIQHGKNGFKVKPFKINEFLKYLKNLMANDNLLTEIAKNTIDINKKFSSENILNQWIDLFDKFDKR